MKMLSIERAAAKALASMPGKDAKVLRKKLEAYAGGAVVSLDVKPLAGTSYLRLRHGDWRAVMEETEDSVRVLVIAHRREVCR